MLAQLLIIFLHFNNSHENASVLFLMKHARINLDDNFLVHHHSLDYKLNVILISNESDKVTLKSIS